MMDAQQILLETQQALTPRRVFGDPVHVGDVTVIPVASIGGGGGAGRGTAEHGGVGFGMSARPAGVFVVRDGHVSWRPALNVNLVIIGGQIVALAAIFAARSAFLAWNARRAV